jgi:hypothetical protein
VKNSGCVPQEGSNGSKRVSDLQSYKSYCAATELSQRERIGRQRMFYAQSTFFL